jgi:hypothetical protein
MSNNARLASSRYLRQRERDRTVRRDRVVGQDLSWPLSICSAPDRVCVCHGVHLCPEDVPTRRQLGDRRASLPAKPQPNEPLHDPVSSRDEAMALALGWSRSPGTQFGWDGPEGRIVGDERFGARRFDTGEKRDSAFPSLPHAIAWCRDDGQSCGPACGSICRDDCPTLRGKP